MSCLRGNVLRLPCSDGSDYNIVKTYDHDAADLRPCTYLFAYSKLADALRSAIASKRVL